MIYIILRGAVQVRFQYVSGVSFSEYIGHVFDNFDNFYDCIQTIVYVIMILFGYEYMYRHVRTRVSRLLYSLILKYYYYYRMKLY